MVNGSDTFLTFLPSHIPTVSPSHTPLFALAI